MFMGRHFRSLWTRLKAIAAPRDGAASSSHHGSGLTTEQLLALKSCCL